MLPIVNVFFERCELSTKICDLTEFDEMMTLSDNFPVDVAKYIQGKGTNLTTDNPELDHLVCLCVGGCVRRGLCVCLCVYVCMGVC